jgi:hypothetical protein
LYSFRYIPRSSIAGSNGRSMLRSLHIVFHSGYTSLHSPQWCVKFPFSLYPCQHLSFVVVFLMVAILTEVRWSLSVVLICIFFTVRDGEYFFMCFFAFWISSFEKVLFSSDAHFFTGSLIFEEFRFLSSLYILVISPLSDV